MHAGHDASEHGFADAGRAGGRGADQAGTHGDGTGDRVDRCGDAHHRALAQRLAAGPFAGRQRHRITGVDARGFGGGPVETDVQGSRIRATRVGAGAASSAKRPGRGVTVPIALTSCGNACTVATAVPAWTPAGASDAWAASDAACEPPHPMPNAASAAITRLRRVTADPKWR